MKESDLKIDGVYFIVMYEDEELQIPSIQTLIYLGKESSESGELLYLFKVVQDSSEEEKTFVREADLEALVLSKEGLIAELSE